MESLSPLMLTVCFAMLFASLAFFIWRLVRGPHPLDRALCIDGIALIISCAMALWNVTLGTHFFFEAILVLAIVGFISSVIVAKYLETGDIID